MTKLKENQLLISATGITIKTTVGNIVTWKKCFTDHFKGNGYIVTKTKTLKESVQIVMEKNISIQINFFHNGKITIATGHEINHRRNFAFNRKWIGYKLWKHLQTKVHVTSRLDFIRKISRRCKIIRYLTAPLSKIKTYLRLFQG